MKAWHKDALSVSSEWSLAATTFVESNQVNTAHKEALMTLIRTSTSVSCTPPCGGSAWPGLARGFPSCDGEPPAVGNGCNPTCVRIAAALEDELAGPTCVGTVLAATVGKDVTGYGCNPSCDGVVTALEAELADPTCVGIVLGSAVGSIVGSFVGVVG